MCQAKSKGEVELPSTSRAVEVMAGAPGAGRWLHLTEGDTEARRVLCQHSAQKWQRGLGPNPLPCVRAHCAVTST